MSPQIAYLGRPGYFYEIRNARGNGKSFGPRSAETDAPKTSYDTRKQGVTA